MWTGNLILQTKYYTNNVKSSDTSQSLKFRTPDHMEAAAAMAYTSEMIHYLRDRVTQAAKRLLERQLEFTIRS